MHFEAIVKVTAQIFRKLQISNTALARSYQQSWKTTTKQAYEAKKERCKVHKLVKACLRIRDGAKGHNHGRSRAVYRHCIGCRGSPRSPDDEEAVQHLWSGEIKCSANT